MMLRKIFGPKKDVVCIQFEILSNHRLCELCRLPGSVHIMKCRYVARMGSVEMLTEVWWKMVVWNSNATQRASVFMVLYVWYVLQEFTVLLFTIHFIVAYN